MAILTRKAQRNVQGYESWNTKYQDLADDFDKYIKKEIKRIEEEVKFRLSRRWRFKR